MPLSVEDIVYEFEQDQSLRIKKLLVYACKNIWESDSYRLDYFDVSSLVRELMQLAPTAEHLEERLNQAVASLSKAAEYRLVAQAILAQVSLLYPTVAARTDAAENANLAPEVVAAAAALDAEAEHHRMKKLLYCACRQLWENDPIVLGQVQMAELVQEVRSLAADLPTLTQALESIVDSLNRRAEYTQIAQTVLGAIAPLYPSGSPSADPPSGDSTTVTAIAIGRPLPPPSKLGRGAGAGLHNAPTPLTPSAAPMPADTQPQHPDSHRVAGNSATRNGAIALSLRSHGRSPDAATLMDLRLEVMNYCNPLRAKVLLYSALHTPLPPQLEGWEVLRAHNLASLLQALVQRYSSYAVLQTQMQQTAELLEPTEVYQQAASAILRAVRSLYPGASDPDPAAHLPAIQIEHAASVPPADRHPTTGEPAKTHLSP
ncbi:MAG: hypothetical protein KME20_26010 [Kaiparowitsia implicata GSE-PSE-MK54-09C]|nr:hypothetical protein [Kaiparowitsia implicata GSE-PSE-MK54-09C]